MQRTPVRKPVTVISGFPGVGKSTLVRSILTVNHGMRVAVVVQDPSAVGIDAPSFIQQPGFSWAATPNGCICCPIIGSLGQTLELLRTLDDRFEYLVVETPDLANPIPIAHHFIGGPAAQHFQLHNIVVLVNAHTYKNQLGHKEGLWAGQVAAADQVIITQADGTGNVSELARIITHLNELADIRESHPAALSIKSVLNHNPLEGLRQPPADLSGPPLPPSVADYTSVILEATGDLNPAAINAWLGELLCTHGPSIDRFKGVLCLEGRPPLLLQGVREQCEAGLLTQPWQGGARRSKLVLVGAKNALDPDKLRPGFANCLEGANTQAPPPTATLVAINPRPLLPADEVGWPSRHVPHAIADRYGLCPSCTLCVALDATVSGLAQGATEYARRLRRLELAAVRAGFNLDGVFEGILAEAAALTTQAHACLAALYQERAVLVNLYLDDNKYGLRDRNRLRVGVMAHDAAADSYWVRAQELAAELQARCLSLAATHAALATQSGLDTVCDEANQLITEGLAGLIALQSTLPEVLAAYGEQVGKWLGKKGDFVRNVLGL